MLPTRFIVCFLYMVFILSNSFAQKTSKDNYTGQFIDDNSWVGGTAPSLPVGSDNEDVTIDGYISYGNPPGPNEASNFPMDNNSNSYNLIINDTLVIYGNLYEPNNPMNIIINSGGLLIIFGNFTVNGSLTVNGNLVVGGTNIGISGSNKASFSGTGNVYAYNYNTPGFIPSGQDNSIEPDLQNDLPETYEFLVDGGTTPLPVEIIYFKGYEQDESVRLEWATSYEENFNFFTIERSLDGMTFYEYGKIFSKTTYSDLIKKYEFIDEMPFPGFSYYRLKATDFNGFFEYHGVVYINLENVQSNILLYPNPVIGNWMVISYNGKTGYSFSIANVLGNVVTTGTISPGLNEINISSFMDKGVYYIHFKCIDRIITKKFIIK